MNTYHKLCSQWFLIANSEYGFCIGPQGFNTKAEAEELGKACVENGVWKSYRILSYMGLMAYMRDLHSKNRKTLCTVWKNVKTKFAAFLTSLKTIV